VTKLDLENAHLISEFSQDLQATQVIFSLCSPVVNGVDEIPDTHRSLRQKLRNPIISKSV